jgi:transposase
VAVHSAGIQDTNGAYLVVNKMAGLFSRLVLIWVDGGYKNKLIDWAAEQFNLVMEVIKRNDTEGKFTVLPKRWIVERTLSWIANNRRTSKDYEHNTTTSEAIVYLSMIRLMLKRLTK